MAKISLSARPALGGAEMRLGPWRLEERADISIYSIAMPQGGAAALEEAMRSAFGLALPGPRDSSAAQGLQMVRMAVDQYFLIAEDPMPDLAARLGDAGYVTDQTDAWVTCALTGPGLEAPLARVVALDLEPAVFPPGGFARTQVEHMGAALLRQAEACFWLLSARSSAASFWQAIETSMRYAARPR